MEDKKVYIVEFTSNEVKCEDLLSGGNCILTSNGDLLFNDVVVGKMSEMSIGIQNFMEAVRKNNFVVIPPTTDIRVTVAIQGTNGKTNTVILGCGQILSDKEIALQARENAYKIEYSIIRDFDGVSKSIQLTKEEMGAIYSKMDRIYKVMEGLNDLNNNLDAEIEFESLTLEQKELLEIVQGEFESELMNDLGPVYNETISFHKEELKMAFPDLDFDVQQFA